MPIRSKLLCFISLGAPRRFAAGLLPLVPGLHLCGHPRRVLSGALRRVFIRVRMARLAFDILSSVAPPHPSLDSFYPKCATTSSSTTNSNVLTILWSSSRRYAREHLLIVSPHSSADLARLTAIINTADSVAGMTRTTMTVNRRATTCKWERMSIEPSC